MPRSVNSHWYFILNLQGGSAVKKTMHCSCKCGSQHPCWVLVSVNTCTLMHISKQRYMLKIIKAFVIFFGLSLWAYMVCACLAGELRGQLCGLDSLSTFTWVLRLELRLSGLPRQTPVAFTHWAFLLTLLIFLIHKRQQSPNRNIQQVFCAWLV